jgi:hypothetical protein
MASPEKVKVYLACWFQLGKKLIFADGRKIALANSVINGDRYSSEFEACWQEIMDQEGKNCYLEGTEPTLDTLFSPAWDIFACARCNMPVPKLEFGGQQELNCPCFDLPLWPNLELPIPHAPINGNSRLQNINARLKSKNRVD